MSGCNEGLDFTPETSPQCSNKARGTADNGLNTYGNTFRLW